MTESRKIFCIHCGGELTVSPKAFSVNCRYCNRRVGVEDHHIGHYHAGTNIETGGDVSVTSRGHVRARIHVKNLQVQPQGQVYGNVIAEEKVTVETQANLLGDVTARRLEVQPGAHLKGFYRIGPAPSDTDEP